MRLTFVVVVAVGIAAAVGISALRGREPEREGRTEPAPPLERSSDPGGGSPAPAPEPVSPEGPELARGDAEDPVAAARRLLAAEAAVLADAEARRRALALADALVSRADASTSRAGVEQRMLARKLVAAVYGRGESTREERDAALRRSSALFEALIRGNGAPPELVLRHKIAAGENVWTLSRGAWKAAGASVAPGFVLWLNGVSDARRVRVGQSLKVPLEPLTVVVRKSSFELTVLLGGAPVDRFDVAVGADAKTPVGSFRAGDCLKNPDWYIDGRRIPFGSPGHIIGTRWIALTGAPEAEGIGIHGTDDETSIGRPVSLGCVRMRNADVERVFDWVAPGTPVEIRD